MRFLAFRTVGVPGQVVDRIRAAARSLQLTAQIPLVKLQRNPPHEFYLFLGIRCDDPNELPPNFHHAFLTVTRLSSIIACLSRDDIAHFVGRADIETHGLNSLPYQPHRAADPGDPFDTSEVPAPAQPNADHDAGAERLLGWISASGRGSWQMFANACHTLGLADTTRPPRALLRHLVLLGHIELSSTGREWCAAPAAVVECAADSGLRFLAGARTPMSTGGVAFDPQPGSCAPPRARLTASETPANSAAAGAAANRLATILPDLDGWKAALPRLDRVNAMVGRVEWWDGQRFAEDPAFVDAPGPHQSSSGLYRLVRGEGHSERGFIAYFDAPAAQWLQGDWNGLAFLARQEEGTAAVTHDAASSRLLIPAAERWPLLFEKALVLGSGLLPSRCGKKSEWLCYDAIPAELAQQLAWKLNVPLKIQSHA